MARRARTSSATVLLTLISTLAAAGAAAQEHDAPGDPAAHGHGEGIGLELENRLGVHPGGLGEEAEPSAAIDVLGARYHGLEHLFFAAELEVAAFNVPGAGTHDAGLQVGNPVLEGGFVTHAGHLELEVGLGVALPVAHADDEMQHFGYELADAVDAAWDLWDWAPDYLGLLLPVGAVLHNDRLTLELELGAGYLVYTGDHHLEDELVLQARLGARYAVAGLFMPGLRVQGVWRAKTEVHDAAQLAVNPYLRLADEEAFAELGLMLPLDEPYGFLGHGEGIWSVHVAVGVEL